MITERTTAPPLPCGDPWIRKHTTSETPLPDGRVLVSRSVYWIDGRGEEQWDGDEWIVPAPAAT